MDWRRVGKQPAFLAAFALASVLPRRLTVWMPERDRRYAGLIWLALCGFGADWAKLHFMVGAFLAGAVVDAHWFDQRQMDLLRHPLLLVLMPVFFVSTGPHTNWALGGGAMFLVAGGLLVACVVGKLPGAGLAGRIPGWRAVRPD